MRRLGFTLLGLVAFGLSALSGAPAVAAGAAYLNSPGDVPYVMVNQAIQNVNTTLAPQGSGTVGGALFIPTVASSVNLLSITPGATGTGVALAPGGPSADTNAPLLLQSAGTSAVHLGGTTAANASVRAPTVASAVNQVQLSGSVTGSPVLIAPGGSGVDTNGTISLAGAGTGIVMIGGATTTLAGLQVAQTASRVNDFVLTPGATASIPTLIAGGAGADANIGALYGTTGTGKVYLGGPTTLLAPLEAVSVASSVNSVLVTSAATGNVPVISVGGASVDATRNLSILGSGANGIVVLGATQATCSGTTTATCQGQRFVASVTSLTTAAAGTTSAAMTVTNASVASSATEVVCQVNGYGGTGVPIATTVTPGTGSVSFTITNVAASGSLNATVPVACFVVG